MNLRFTIIDYTNDPDGISTVVDEPVGWDTTGLRLKRDPTWHGFFDFFDDSYSGMQWHGAAHTVLKAAYDANGVEANCELLVEIQCSNTDEYEQVYLGRFVFKRYKNICSDMCYVLCGVENSNCLKTFKSRYDQKVDLDSLFPFDKPCENETITVASANFIAAFKLINTGTPALTDRMYSGMTIIITGTASNDGTYTVDDVGNTGGFTVIESLVDEAGATDFEIEGCFYTLMDEYENLSKPINLPSKLISYKNIWAIENDTFEYTDDLLNGEPVGTFGYYYFPFEWNVNTLTEINDSNRVRSEYTELEAEDTDPFESYTQQNDGIVKIDMQSELNCWAETNISIEMEGDISIESSDTLALTGTITLFYGNDTDGYISVTLQGGINTQNTTIPISISYSDTILLKPNDKIYIQFILANISYLTGGGGGTPSDPFELTINVDSADLKIELVSQCETSLAKVSMVNETLSRITEAYTSDCLRVKSDYFGRTDSQPYTSDENGCGALECLTSGVRIRAKGKDTLVLDETNSLPANFKLSMKQAFEGLNAIHNIGMGIEPDTERGGNFEWVRVERMPYFYKNDVLMECDNIMKVERELDETKVFSTGKIGYQKWETETANGLNDVFGKREYRTTLNQVTNNLEKLSAFIASDYAIEVTRRTFSDSTRDWRYDNDTFIICLTNCWTGEISYNTLTNYIRLLDNPPSGIVAGGTIVISGSGLGNDGTYTIGTIEQNDLDAAIFEVLEPLTGAGAETATICGVILPEIGNIDSASNILYPETAYNLRITPSRNAIRHLKTLFQSYRDYANGKLIFTAGDGNFVAIIDLNDDDCLNEDGGLAENQDLQPSDLVDEEIAFPLFWPELVKFEYPMSWEQYKVIRANPYGLIGYQCGNDAMEYGWIEDFQYKPYKGLAEFTLRPKIEA